MSPNAQKIIDLSDGKRASREIAKLLGLNARYVRRVMSERGCPQLGTGAQPGARNNQFVSGRRIDRYGYVLVTAANDHPYARNRTNRGTKLILEHRLVLEQKLGRYLLPEEIADHIDGLTLHNAPSNLRVFASNADHLRATLTGHSPQWSKDGLPHIGRGRGHKIERPPVDSHRLRIALGEIRLQQILLLALKLGTDSPFLLGTNRHTEKAQIDMSSRSTIERALAELNDKWEQRQIPSLPAYRQRYNLAVPR